MYSHLTIQRMTKRDGFCKVSDAEDRKASECNARGATGELPANTL